MPSEQRQRARRRGGGGGCDCRLLPHGGYTLIPATLSTMAWIASLAQDGCDYARLESGPTVQQLTNSDMIPFLEVGFTAYREPQYDTRTDTFQISYSGPCIQYDEDVVPIDASWKIARGCAFLSLVFGGGGALFLWFSSCFVFGPGTWRWAGYEVLAASMFQCLAFLWFNTAMCRSMGNTCGMFFGSRSDVVAAVFWFVSAMAIFARYPTPEPKVSRRNEPALPETASSEDGDGSEGGQAVSGGGGGGAGTAMELPLAGSRENMLPVSAKDGGGAETQPRPRDIPNDASLELT